jgi:hypothetical protein
VPNIFGEHAVHCRELPDFKYRHDLVRDVLFDIFRCAEISVKKEAPVNFLTYPQEGRLTLRPSDGMVYGWVGGKHTCVDLTGVSSLWDCELGILLWDGLPSKLLQAKRLNMRKHFGKHFVARLPFINM